MPSKLNADTTDRIKIPEQQTGQHDIPKDARDLVRRPHGLSGSESAPRTAVCLCLMRSQPVLSTLSSVSLSRASNSDGSNAHQFRHREPRPRTVPAVWRVHPQLSLSRVSPGSSREAEDAPQVAVAALKWRKRTDSIPETQSQPADCNDVRANCPGFTSFREWPAQRLGDRSHRFQVLAVCTDASSVTEGAGSPRSASVHQPEQTTGHNQAEA